MSSLGVVVYEYYIKHILAEQIRKRRMQKQRQQCTIWDDTLKIECGIRANRYPISYFWKLHSGAKVRKIT